MGPVRKWTGPSSSGPDRQESDRSVREQAAPVQLRRLPLLLAEVLFPM